MPNVNFMNAEETMREAAKRPHVECKKCGRVTSVVNGVLLRHNESDSGAKKRVMCPGSGERP